jgi:hypothetical protein
MWGWTNGKASRIEALGEHAGNEGLKSDADETGEEREDTSDSDPEAIDPEGPMPVKAVMTPAEPFGPPKPPRQFRRSRGRARGTTTFNGLLRLKMPVADRWVAVNRLVLSIRTEVTNFPSASRRSRFTGTGFGLGGAPRYCCLRLTVWPGDPYLAHP